MKLSALPYYGGKSARANSGTGAWVSRTIGPTPKVWTYCEPFAGMLGVLLQRPPAQVELVNDTDRWVISWWRAVRDHAQEFSRRIEATPNSRDEFERACQQLENGPTGDTLQDGITAHVIISQGMTHGTNAHPSNWQVKYSPGIRTLGRMRAQQVQALAKRIRDVQLESRDALELLERTASERRILLYCDPPYRSANTGAYGQSSLDWDALAALFQAQQGQVAISGYGDEWDGLGWRRKERPAAVAGIGKQSKRKADPRTEVLWLNFDPPPAGFLDDWKG